MKIKLLGILFLLTLFSCNQSVKTEKQIPESAKTDSCKFPVDTFAFKEFKIGMDISNLNNIQKLPHYQSYLTSEATYLGELSWVGVFESIEENLPNISTYSVDDNKNNSIFKNKIKEIKLGVYKGRIFSISLFTENNGNNLVNEIRNKFNLGFNCIKQFRFHGDEEFPEYLASTADYSNTQLRLFCAYWDKRPGLRGLTSGGGALIVRDETVNKIVNEYIDTQLKQKETMRKDSVSKDF
jgi:hypothetical protein